MKNRKLHAKWSRATKKEIEEKKEIDLFFSQPICTKFQKIFAEQLIEDIDKEMMSKLTKGKLCHS